MYNIKKVILVDVNRIQLNNYKNHPSFVKMFFEGGTP